MSEQTKYQKHYQKYRESIRRSQKLYYDKNVDKIKAYHKDKYDNDPVYKEKRRAEMRRYQDRKKNEDDGFRIMMLSR